MLHDEIFNIFGVKNSILFKKDNFDGRRGEKEEEDIKKTVQSILTIEVEDDEEEKENNGRVSKFVQKSRSTFSCFDDERRGEGRRGEEVAQEVKVLVGRLVPQADNGASRSELALEK